MPECIQCPDCGAELPPGQPMGLCPRCALKGALELSEAMSDPHPASGHPLPSDGRGAGGEGRSFGDYELLEEIARGGMGIVFKARQRKLDRIVAVKMILAGQFASKEQSLRFRVEAEAAARLQHPNIVRIHETGEQDGQPYFSMDYIEGSNLATLVREKPLPAKRAAMYVKTIAEAIHYAHEQGILHRDLKPSNVLIDHAAQPRVTDFGLAKRMTKESFLTVTGDVMGSPSFMPPEQAGYRSSRREEAQTESAECEMRSAESSQILVTLAATKIRAGRYSDVYGLGAILFYLVTGRPPFVAENVAETLHHVLNTEPVSPRLLNPSVPEDIATICLKCLEKEPAKRYQTAQQLADELGRFLNDEPIHARPTTRPEKVWRWCRRKPALAGTVAVATGAICAAAMFGLQARHTGQQRLHERRQNTLEKAWLVAWSGDQSGTEELIREAELAGASIADVRLLHGLVAYHRGEFHEAIQQMEQVVKLSPESVAAQSMLAIAYPRIGNWSNAGPRFQLLASLPPKTPEDYLLKGMAESEWDPARGLATLDQGFRRRPTGIARLIRTQARRNLAIWTGILADAEAALTDANVVRELLPDNPTAIGLSLSACLVAAGVYEGDQQNEKRDAVLRQAAIDAAALGRFPTNRNAIVGRITYLGYAGDEQTALKELGEAAPRMQNALIDYLHASALYRNHRFQEALEAISTHTAGSGNAADYVRGFILAELPDGPERAVNEFHQVWQSSQLPEILLIYQTTLRLLGRKAEAVKACQSARRKPVSLPPPEGVWISRLLDYNCELMTASELLKAAGLSKWHQCDAHFNIAMTKLAEGDRSSARDHFRAALATHDFYSFEGDWSRAFLARMEKDPSWPPWIPAKPELQK